MPEETEKTPAQGLLDFLERHPPLNPKAKLQARKREDGLIELVDEQGRPFVMMDVEDYQALLDWEAAGGK
jgi:hypothetical protein